MQVLRGVDLDVHRGSIVALLGSNDSSGYRRYDASAVVRLIRIRALVGAGVPLSQVRELLAAGSEHFAVAVKDIDRRLRAEIHEIHEKQEHRRRIARLAAGDSLALPAEAVAYLDHLRWFGSPTG